MRQQVCCWHGHKGNLIGQQDYRQHYQTLKPATNGLALYKTRSFTFRTSYLRISSTPSTRFLHIYSFLTDFRVW